MKTLLVKIAAISAIALSFSGCALLASDVNALWELKVAHEKVFDKDPADCYDLTVAALTKWHAVVYQKEKGNYIVAMEFESVFRSCINTTEVGIFFTENSPHKTEVRVTSLNYNLSEFVARHLFDYIAKDGKLPEAEELKPVAPKSAHISFKSINAGSK